MTVLARSEFIDYFRNLDHRIDGADPLSPLWIPEEDGDVTCNWFVCVPPLGVDKFKWKYFEWCNQALCGKVRCFSSDAEGQKEWWGFTHQEDIMIWMLKWM